jgi:predicted RND superfamily exporter protein
MREKILKKLAGWHANSPWRMLLIVTILTLLFAGFAGKLKMTMRTSDLLPEGDPKVLQFNEIIDEFATATNLIVVVQGEEQKIKEYADTIAPLILDLKDSSQNESIQKEIEKLEKKIDKAGKKNDQAKIAELRTSIENLRAGIDKKLFQRIDYKAPADFLRHHMLMLAKSEDLEDLKEFFTDPNLIGFFTNINNSMEKEYVGQEESISTREKEEGAFQFLDGIQDLIINLKKSIEGKNLTEEEIEAVVDKLLFGEPYFLSYDKTALILNVIPNFSLMEREYIMVAAEMGQALVENLNQNFPEVEAGLSGQIAREYDEQTHAQQSIGYTSVFAMIAILIFLIVSFRMWVAPLLAIINLMVGIIWAMGTAGIMVGQLNLLTATLSVVLLGLGIDFSIHLISGFTEWRAAGDSIGEALDKTFLKSGKGIITGGLTTACAFLTLNVSSAKGMKEMGLVAGFGLIAIMIATLLVLPVMLVFRERGIDRRREKGKAKQFVQRDISFKFLGRSCEWLSRRYVFTILTGLILSGLLAWSAVKIRWDYDFRNMEPKGLQSVELIDTILEKFDLSMEYAMLLTDSLEESRGLAESYREISTVALANDISIYLPTPEEQQKRIDQISEIRRKMESATLNPAVTKDDMAVFKEEMARLEMNIIEIQDMAFLGGQDKVDNKCKKIVGDPENEESRSLIQELFQSIETYEDLTAERLSQFQHRFAPRFKESVILMSSMEPIRLEELPSSVLDGYTNPARNKYLVTIYPSGDIYNGEFLNRFVEDLERVSEKATGMPPLTIALVKVFGRDGRNAVLLTLAIVFLLLWIDFKKPSYALTAMIPLALGVFWMVGLMNLTGIALSIMSVMGLPLIIGIGIDDGVHIMHRWKNEGNGRIYTVFSSTGKAILLTSLTTMLAFGSMVFSVFPAWGQFGGSLFYGVGACFLTTVVILPGILGWIDRRNNKKKQS